MGDKNTPRNFMADDLSITVIVLLYNDMPHGLSAIESVLSQSFQGFKLAIVDNGSTDDTWQRIQKYANDPRVTLYRNEKNIRSGAVQPIADKVTTEYLSFLFADDVYEPMRLEHGISYLEDHPDHHYVFYRNSFVDEKDNMLNYVPHTLFSGDISALNRWQHVRHMFTSGNTLHPCGMIIRSKTYQRLGGFKNFLHRIGDMTFFARLLINENGAFLPQKMQRITVWSCKRNESTQNAFDTAALIAERSYFFEEYLKPEAIENMGKILATDLKTESECYWALAHEAMRAPAMDYQTLAVTLLYKAAEIADECFNELILERTGKSINEYIQSEINKLPTKAKEIFWRQLIKKIPGTLWAYSKLSKQHNSNAKKY